MLDKSKDYGQMYGNAKHKYVQNGKLYNVEGIEVDSLGRRKPKRKPVKVDIISDDNTTNS